MKQLIEIDVPDGWKLVERRKPKRGEHYINDCNKIITASCEYTHEYKLVITKVWEPPVWLKRPGWLFSNDGTEWVATNKKPINVNSYYYLESGAHFLRFTVETINMCGLTFTPPDNQYVELT